MLYHTDGGIVNERGDFTFLADGRPLLVAMGGGCLRIRWGSRVIGGEPPQRGAIGRFSESSKGRMRRFLRSCTAQYRNLITLTYPCGYPSDGRTVKGHLRSFVERCRRYLGPGYGSQGLFWFLEFQERGAPHFHLFTTFSVPRETVSRWWYDIVGSEDERHLRAGTRIEALTSGREGAIAYAVKYATKSEQKEVPQQYSNVGRFWGACFNRECLEAATRIMVRESGQPRTEKALQSLKDVLKTAVRDKRAKKHSPNGRFTVYLLRDISTQRAIQDAILGVAFAYQMESGIGVLCTPITPSEFSPYCAEVS